MFRPNSNAILVPAFCGIFGIVMAAPLPLAPIQKAMKDRTGAFVIIDCGSGEITELDPKSSAERLPPCSTFKIWNALLGFEEGILSSPEEAFYQWDGINRDIAAWNKDLNLRDAFQASCVPAFQRLASRLGSERMNRWLDTIGYGDRNASAGLDVFWLPAPALQGGGASGAETRSLVETILLDLNLLSNSINP